MMTRCWVLGVLVLGLLQLQLAYSWGFPLSSSNSGSQQPKPTWSARQLQGAAILRSTYRAREKSWYKVRSLALLVHARHVSKQNIPGPLVRCKRGTPPTYEFRQYEEGGSASQLFSAADQHSVGEALCPP